MKKKLIGGFLAFCIIFGMSAAMPAAASAANSSQTSQNFVMMGSDNYIIKSDGALWDINTNKKIADNVTQCGYIGKANTTGGGRYMVKADGTLWELAFTENSYASGKVSRPAEKLMNDVRHVYFQPYKSAEHNGEFFFVIKNDSSLWRCGGWTRNNPGDLKARISPAKLMDNVASLVFSQDYREEAGNLFVLKTDGSLWGWGDNTNGELGDGTTEKRGNPIKIMDGVASFAYGVFSAGTASHVSGGTAYAVKTDGTLWGWGHNGCYQLGNGSLTDSHSPVKLMDDVMSVDADSGHVSVVRPDGTLWSWGIKMGKTYSDEISSGGGSVFQISYEHNPIPVRISDQVKYTFSNVHADYFIKNDNTLWYVGGGMLADPLERTTTPVKLMDNVASIRIYSTYGFAVTRDQSLWGWGYNEKGQLGGGAREVCYSPIKILDGIKLPAAATAHTIPGTSALTAAPISSAVLVNGKSVAFDAYNINGNNFFKLRDLADTLSGTEKQFDVGWDGVNNLIALTSGQAYSAAGGGRDDKGAGNKTAKATASAIYLDGKEIIFNAYNIEGSNYFKLRDIGKAFDFAAGWDGVNNTIVIDTGRGYTGD